MKKIAIILIILFSTFTAFSQNITPSHIKYFSDSVYNGKVKIKQDAAVKHFMETCSGLNKKREGFPGYRVKVFAQNKQNSRSQANAIKAACSNEKHDAYVSFTEPNFEVHVGDYLTRFDALQCLNELIGKYPEAYIIKATVTYPKR